MSALDEIIDENFVLRLSRGEPWVFEGQLEDIDGNVEPLDGRTFYGCVMAADGTRLREAVAEFYTDKTGVFYRGVIDGSMSDDLFGQSGLLWWQGERTNAGVKPGAQGSLVIYPGPGVQAPEGPSGIAAVATRFIRRETQTGRTRIRKSQQGARGAAPWEARGQTEAEYTSEIAGNVTGATLDALGETVDAKVDPLAAATDYRYTSRAAAAASFIPAVAQQVTITGWVIFADAFRSTWRRVAAKPSHPACFRSKDSFLPDGSTSGINGGWWELYEDRVRPEWLADPNDTKTGLPLARDAALALNATLELQPRIYTAPDDFEWKPGTRNMRIRGAGGGLTQIRQGGAQWSKVLRFVGDTTWWQLARSGTATMATRTISNVDVTGIAVGNAVIGEFVQDGTLITAVGANSIVLSVAPLVDGAIEIVVRQAVETRPQLHISGVTFGRDNAATYSGPNSLHTLSADYFSIVRFDDLTIDGSAGWGITTAFCEDAWTNNCRISNSRGGKGGGTGTDGINKYKCRYARITNCYVINVGDDPCSIGCYDKGWYTERAEISGNTWLGCTGSGKFYGLVRNYTCHNNVGAFCMTGGVGVWNDRAGAGAGNMPRGRITDNKFWFCGTTGSAGAIFLYSSNGSALDPVTWIESVLISGNQCYGGQYALSIHSNDDVLNLKRARGITVRGNVFSGQTIDALHVYGLDGYLTVEGNELYGSRGRFGFIKYLGDRTKVSFRNNICDGCLSSPPTAAPVGLLISTGKDILLTVEGNKFRGNKRGLFTDAVRTENMTLHPRSTNDNELDASFTSQSVLSGARGSALGWVRGLAALPSTNGYTVHDDQVFAFTQAASSAAPGMAVKVGGTRGTLVAADGASAVTATTTAGSPLVQLSDAAGVFPGCYITIAGVTITNASNVATSRLPVLEVNGTVATLPVPVNEAVAGAAVSYFAPTLTPWAVASSGSVVAPPMDGANFLVDLDSMVGQGHTVRTTLDVKLLAASGHGIKLRFSDAWQVWLEWQITGEGVPNDTFFRQEVIRFRTTAPSGTTQNVDWCQEAAALYAERVLPFAAIGTLPGTFAMTCPNYGAAHAPVELVFTPAVKNPARNYEVTLTLRANKSGGN